ncbi:hypothetical protein T4B_3637 [Trichinella pseudospiralis]|uniref:Uncharacterized protein n=2 Tax=Trichinella pseudospiralis TaxID=6337 RepID=A0A0V1G2S1_TRIPS|nr:hypothetical protein T4D_1430 [Trichinella pseudospiralis]KRZ34798.1 hypothetical protein T4B_3637 [Trichinella pseudospiralis]
MNAIEMSSSMCRKKMIFKKLSTSNFNFFILPKATCCKFDKASTQIGQLMLESSKSPDKTPHLYLRDDFYLNKKY